MVTISLKFLVIILLIFSKEMENFQFEWSKRISLVQFFDISAIASINPGISYVFALHQMTSLQYSLLVSVSKLRYWTTFLFIVCFQNYSLNLFLHIGNIKKV